MSNLADNFHPTVDEIRRIDFYLAAFPDALPCHLAVLLPEFTCAQVNLLILHSYISAYLKLSWEHMLDRGTLASVLRLRQKTR